MPVSKIDTLKIRDLPTLPDILMKLNRVLSEKSVTIEAVNNIIEKDPALTAKILKLANSSYYGLSYRVDTLKRAVTVLGFNTIRNLAVTVSVFNMFTPGKGTSINIKELWYHSLGCAVASKSLLYKSDPLLQEKGFMCGILHDIGKIIIAQNLPDEMEVIIKKIKENKSLTQNNLEKELLGFTHSELGTFISEKWHFPRDVACAINSHHNPEKFSSLSETPDKPEEAEILVYGVYTGNQVAKAMALGKSSDRGVSNINPLAWEKLAITERDLPEILVKIKENFNEVVNSWNF